MKPSSRGALVSTSLLALLLLPASLLAEPIPLKHIVELALSHATAGAIAAADEQRADAAYQELRKSYIPNSPRERGLARHHMGSRSHSKDRHPRSLPSTLSRRSITSPCGLQPKPRRPTKEWLL